MIIMIILLLIITWLIQKGKRKGIKNIDRKRDETVNLNPNRHPNILVIILNVSKLNMFREAKMYQTAKKHTHIHKSKLIWLSTKM